MFGRPWPRTLIVSPPKGQQGRPHANVRPEDARPEDVRPDAGEPVRRGAEEPRPRPQVNPFALLAPMALRRRRDAVLAATLPALATRWPDREGSRSDDARGAPPRPHG